jgi:hypothetical protein
MVQGEYRIIRGGRDIMLPTVRIFEAPDNPLLKITNPPDGVPALWEIELGPGKRPVGRSIASADITKQPENSIILTGIKGGLVLNAKPLEVPDISERNAGEFSPLENKVLATVGQIYKKKFDNNGADHEVYEVLNKTTTEEFYIAAHKLEPTKQVNLKTAFDLMEEYLMGGKATPLFDSNEISMAFAIAMDLGDQVIPEE